jgi:protein SCO1/2
VHARLRLALGVAVACAAALVLVVALSASGGGSLELVAGYAGALEPASLPAENFALHDQDGRMVRLSDFAGRVTIVTFLYSTCTTTCPVTAQQIRGALDQLGKPVPIVAVSVDPKNDTPLNASRFLVKQSLAGRMEFLLGSRAELAPIWRAYGIQPQSEISGSASDHTAEVVLVDKAGRPRIGFPESALTPEALAHDVRALEALPAPSKPPRRETL